MPLAWTLAKFLFKVVVPTVPEIVSTVATMKRQQLRDETGEDMGPDFDQAIEQMEAGEMPDDGDDWSMDED